MKIDNLTLPRLRNSEHLQFHIDVMTLVNSTTAAALGIDVLFKKYAPTVNLEKETLNTVTKSASTNTLAEADETRDETFRGIRDVVKGFCRHYNDEVKDAATKIKIVFDTYGNVAVKSYNQETAEITSLVSELNSSLKNEIKTIGITEWIAALKQQNETFDDIKNSRYSEEASKTSDSMKDIRIGIDDIYSSIVERINALIVINGDKNFKDFVNGLNVRIASYTTALNQRQGRNREEELVLEV